MSYLQLEIGGQTRGLKFNQKAYITFYDFVDKKDFEGTFHYAAIYAALLANAYVKREEFTETFETVCDWVDLLSADDKTAVTKVFNETAFWKKLVEDGAKEVEDNTKKKKRMSTMKKA